MPFVNETVKLNAPANGRPTGDPVPTSPFGAIELLAIEKQIQEHADAININFGSTIDVDTAPSATDTPELRGKLVTVKSSGTDQLWFYGNIAGVPARTQLFP